MSAVRARAVLLALVLACGDARASERFYDVLYKVDLVPERHGAAVTLLLHQTHPYAREFVFDVDPARQQSFAGDGRVVVEGEHVRWSPPATGGELRWFVTLEHERGKGAYDSVVTNDWAVFRGDDLVPAATLRKLKGARSRSRLQFRLPKDWTSITPYPRGDDGVYEVVHEARGFDRPTGWMALGHLGVLWGTVAGTRLAVAGPVGTGLRHQDLLAFLRWTMPTTRSVFPLFPARLLVVGAGDPMWHGGLSGPASVYVHADRPLISENGTSTLLHEIVHVAMGLQAERGSDWIVEAFAELYSLEILERSGTIGRRHYRDALAQLGEWGKHVDTLFRRSSVGATTARGVVVLKALDDELRAATNGAHTLDDLARELAGGPPIGFADFRARAEKLAGRPLKSLASANVPGAPRQ